MKKRLLQGLSLCVGLATASLFFNDYFDALEKRNHAEFVRNHPYNQRTPINKKDLKAIPKKDRPDLAMEREFLLTMDPKLKRPATERLIPIIREVNQKRKAFQSQKWLPGANESLKWNERGPNNVGGRTRAIMFDPNDAQNLKVWAGGVGGGLWYTNDITNDNAGWNSVDDFWANIAISCIAYDPFDTQVFYVGTGEGWFNSDAQRGAGLWKTTDGGATWSQLASTNNSAFHYIQDVLVHPFTQQVYVGTRNGLYRSSDGGASFEYILGGRVADLEIGADNTLYVATGIFSAGYIYASTTGNSGSWNSIAGTGFPTSGVNRIELAPAPNDANVIYAMTHDPGTNDVGGIYRTANKGANWTSLPLPDWRNGDNFARGQAWYDLIIGVNPTNANELYIGGVDLFKSTNGGSTWSQLTDWWRDPSDPIYAHADQHAIVFRPGNPSFVVFGNDGGLSVSTNSGSTFSTRVNNYNVTQFYSVAIHPDAGDNRILGGAQDNGSHLISGAGLNSSVEVLGGDGCFAFIDQTNDDVMIASTQYGNFRKYTKTGSYLGDLTTGSTGSFINPADYDDRENILYSAVDNSTNSITRVRNVASGSPISETLNTSLDAEATHLRVSPYAAPGTSTLFVGTSGGGVFKIINAHNNTMSNTTNISVPGSGSISCIEIGASENELLVTKSNYGVTSVYYSNNGGSSWINKEGDLPDMPVRWALFNPNDRSEVILATEVGVWGTNNIQASSVDWEPHVNGMANVRVDMLQYRESDLEVVAGTHGRGFYSSPGFNGIAELQAFFSASDTVIYEGESVSFTSESTGNPDTYTWSFEGGVPATFVGENPPAIAYPTEGCYDVQLIVTKGLEADTLLKSCYIEVEFQVPCEDLMVINFDDNPLVNATDQANFQLNYYDEDNFPPNSSLSNNGWTSGWNGINSNGNQFVGVTSWFATPMTASNYMIFGPITMPSEGGSINWKHYFPDNNYRDGYRVIINTTGDQIADFNAPGAVVLETYLDNDPRTDGDTATFSNHSAAIPATYAGQQVYFAIHHNANDMFIVYYDDIIVEGCELGNPPAADFSADATVIETNSSVNFTDESTGGANAWVWDFGGGVGNNTERNPQNVAFNNPGCYTISLIASNAAGADTVTKTCYIEAIDLPVSDFEADTVNINVGGTVQFTDLSTNAPDAWSWNFEGADQSTSNLQNPSATYNTIGCFEVSLIASKQGLSGSQETKSCYINVIQAPTADFVASKTVMETGDTVSFTDLTTGSADNWSWSFPGSVQGSSNAQNPEGIQYNNPGVYNVSLTVTILGQYPSTETKSTYIEVIDLPVAAFEADTLDIWEGQTVNFTDLSTNNPDAWSWTFNGGTPGTSTAQNPSVVYNTPGCFDVGLQVFKSGLDGVSTSENCYINVKEKPAADFSASANLILVGGTVDFTNNSSGEHDTYEWSFPGSVQGSSTDANPSGIQYNSTGVFDVQLKVSSGGLFPDSIIQVGMIEVIEQPMADFTASDTIIFTNSTIDFTFDGSGTYDLTEWSFEGGSPGSSSDLNPSNVMYADSGCFEVSLTVSYKGQFENSMTKSCYIRVNSDVGIEEADTLSWKMYPSPANAFLMIEGLSQGTSYELVSIQGQRMAQGIIQSDQDRIDVSHLPVGVYLFRVTSESSTESLRFVINR